MKKEKMKKNPFQASVIFYIVSSAMKKIIDFWNKKNCKI